MENIEYLLISYGIAWGLMVGYVGYVHLRVEQLETTPEPSNEE